MLERETVETKRYATRVTSARGGGGGADCPSRKKRRIHFTSDPPTQIAACHG